VGPKAGLGGRKISPPTGIRSRTVQPVAQLLYRLNYSARQCKYKVLINLFIYILIYIYLNLYLYIYIYLFIFIYIYIYILIFIYLFIPNLTMLTVSSTTRVELLDDSEK